MALVVPMLEVLHSVVLELATGDCKSRRILSLGYPDVLASSRQIARIFGESLAANLVYRADSAEILRWHGSANPEDRVPDATSLFALLGYDLETMDIVPARGGEMIHDLNEPVPQHYGERYAAVLDAGTIEHCFNVAQAVKNVAHMVARGGAAMHINPLNMYNHGFYNFSPTWYHDFYETNGFVVGSLRLVADTAVAPRVGQIPPYARFKEVPENSMLLVVAWRREICSLRWPIQKKYRDYPLLGH